MDASWMSIMIRKRVLVAGIIFCLLFISIIFILISGYPYEQISGPGKFSESGSQKPDRNENNSSSPISTISLSESSLISGTGVVVYEDIEGGFYGVISDEGRRFRPQGIPDELKVNGTKIAFSFRPDPETLSVFMWGEPVVIAFIQAVSPAGIIQPGLPLMEYERAGGISGSFESLSIYPDGRGVVSKWNLAEEITLDLNDMKNLTKATNISGFSNLKSEYMPPGPAPDAVTYTITLNNKSIKTMETEVPMQIKPLLSLLNDILDKNTISPVQANMTLEGTSWKLSSFTRNDGIPVILPLNSRVTAVFEKGFIINGSTGCSPYSSSYNQSGTSISFGPVRMTRMACMEPGAGDVESAFVDLLEKVRLVSGKQKTLTLADDKNTTLLVFNKN